LERNDPSAISQTATKNGVQLKLKDISWTAHETSTVDYVPLPTRYTATAYYAGSYTESSKHYVERRLNFAYFIKVY